jgi:5'-deoxy-5'-methylthioadenosine phosphorylase
MIGIIGGSGLSQLPGLAGARKQIFRTPYGEPSCPLTFGSLNGQPLVFLARHGHGHTIAPHTINYRANIHALKEAGATSLLSVTAVGGIRADLGAEALVVPDDVIDYTYGRRHTFFEGDVDGKPQPVNHVDFTQPFAATMREKWLQGATAAGVAVHVGGVYGCTQGPRLESRAEIRRMARDGCDVVGMTVMPECALAREAELPYGNLSLVVNPAAGVGDSSQTIDIATLNATLKSGMEKVMRVLAKALAVR